MSERAEHAESVLAAADCLHSAEQVQQAYDQLAEQISADLAGKNPLILTVMVGGMLPCAEIIQRLEFAFELDYLHASRYQGELSGGGLVWKVSPSISLEGRHVLIIDDILDVGHTLLEIQRAMQAQNPASLRTAVLCNKQHKRRVDGVHAEYVGLQVPDRYVFGCGMDYRNYHRQLPAIYAVSEAPA